MKPKINCHCPKCGYSWHSKSKLRLVTCPNCGHKVKVERE